MANLANGLLFFPAGQYRPWPTPNIQVCWESMSSPTERQWVKNAIEITWMKVSQVNFYGWAQCPAFNPASLFRGIRVQISYDAESSSATMGVDGSGRLNAVTLVFDFKNAPDQLDDKDPTRRNPHICKKPEKREACIRVNAIHEFGHVLGFDHEQNHPMRRKDLESATCETTTPPPGVLLDLDGYDPDSVMNYCNRRFKYREWPYLLSSNDVRGVQTVYGGKSGTLGGYWGKCVGTLNSQLTHGASVQTQHCGWGITQTWDMTFEYVTPFHRLKQRGQDRYLTVPAGNHAPGTFTQIRAIESYLDSQQFVFTEFLLRSYNNHCAGTADGTLNSGSFVQSRRCDWTPPVRFNFDGGAKKLRIGSKCLEAENAPTGGFLDPRVKINDCRLGAREQEWQFKPNGQLVNQGKCMAYSGFNTGNGGLLYMLPCATDNSILQHWALRGPVVHRPKNQPVSCLDVYYQTNAPYTPVQIYPCNGTLAQEFNYFP